MAKDKPPVTVRILCDMEIDGVQYKSNDVAGLDADVAKVLIADFQVDDNADAVAYAQSLKG